MATVTALKTRKEEMMLVRSANGLKPALLHCPSDTPDETIRERFAKLCKERYEEIGMAVKDGELYVVHKDFIASKSPEERSSSEVFSHYSVQIWWRQTLVLASKYSGDTTIGAIQEELKEYINNNQYVALAWKEFDLKPETCLKDFGVSKRVRIFIQGASEGLKKHLVSENKSVDVSPEQKSVNLTTVSSSLWLPSTLSSSSNTSFPVETQG